MIEWIVKQDVSALLYIQENLRSDVLNGFWKGVTMLGDLGWFWIALAVVLLIPKKTRNVGLAALLSLALGALITNVALKNIVARIRPYDLTEMIVPLIAKPRDYSFPSGHTCASFAAALTFWRMLPRKYGAAAVILASMIAFSRMYVGVHYPTDVLGGFLAALLASSIVYYGMKKAGRLPKETEAEEQEER